MYLISDNRHYMFYLWNKFFRRYFYLRYLLAPVYAFCFYTIFAQFLGFNFIFIEKFSFIKKSSDGYSRLWKLNLLLCIGASLIPSALLEFRYFIQPFILIAFHINNRNTKLADWSEIGLYVVINAIILYAYIYLPFKWPDGSIARFIW